MTCAKDQSVEAVVAWLCIQDRPRSSTGQCNERKLNTKETKIVYKKKRTTYIPNPVYSE